MSYTAISTNKPLGTNASMRAWLLALPRHQKRALQIVVDVFLIWFCLWMAFYLRLDNTNAIHPFSGHAWLFIIAPLISLPIFVRMGLYRAVIRFLGYQALANIAVAVTSSTVLLGLAIFLYNDPPAVIPRSVIIIYWLLSSILIVGLRLTMRQYFRSVPFDFHATPFSANKDGQRDNRVHVLIYGAGAAGNQLLMALRLGGERHPVAFIDDNPDLVNRTIAGLPVYAPAQLAAFLIDRPVQEVLLAIPSASRARRAQIVNFLTPFPLRVRTIPGFMDLASGRVQVQDIREVDISDLLGRDPVEPEPQLFERCIRTQVVMVTGAGGSIGSELCRQIISNKPQALILFEQCEYNLYRIQKELEAYLDYSGQKIQVVSILGSVRSQERLFDVMSAWNVTTVYHAAAYKHVPMVERNSAEGIANNIFGTLYCAQAALRAGVNHFVLISTDKAVRPTNTMGGTKRLAELVLQALAAEPKPQLYGDNEDAPLLNNTRFTMVRFGNVLGSSGSVIPLFREQICGGGPITVTHPEITRYFMTIPEAAQLVIQAGAMGEGGDVFVLDMGEAVKIVDLAEKMILLSGLTVQSAQNPDGDIAIAFVGLRPGEKLYEELLIGENVSQTQHPMIMRANETSLAWEELKSALAQLEEAIKNDDYLRIRNLFFRLVDGYAPDDKMVDWIHVQHNALNALPETIKPLRAAAAITPNAVA